MISPQLARALGVAGLRWRPTSGDMFVIDQSGFEGDVFTLSDMTIEAHEFTTGTVLGFNGTTEWALDSVALDDALWLPAEHQLRALLGSTFRVLRRIAAGAAGDGSDDSFGLGDDGGDEYEVEIVLAGQTRVFAAIDPADAYAGALLVLIGASSDSVEPSL
ncbi:pilus assembly protein CpaE [Subtercola sp. RTI3]|uniref:pilus assembly protein CpaE n=1 Tax=Subtercola sp. RTI3 TaxID=3048639 RepID=UPI002B236F8B|nr:pilus assembly protein CpaE [Subtercola sp. RTI3]MEA9985716.1 pilus assembly protein CpaE [Subtercola sp. RTI3]